MEQRVLDLIKEINSYTSEEGFSIKFAALTAANVVKIRIEGPEVPSARETMRSLTEKMLREHIPEITGVELV